MTTSALLRRSSQGSSFRSGLWRALVRFAVVVALGAVLIAIRAGTAEAYVGESTHVFTGQQQAEIAEHLRRGGTSPAPCGTTCSQLWLDEHRPMPNQPSSNQLHAELKKARRVARALPVARALGVVGLVASTAEVGWIIGTGINRKFLRLGLPGGGGGNAAFTSPKLEPLREGERPPQQGGQNFTCPLADGCWVRTLYSSAWSNQRFANPWVVGQGGGCPGPGPPPAGGMTREVFKSSCYAAGETYVDWGPSTMLDTAGPVEDYNGQTASGGTIETPSTEGDPGPAPADAQAAAIAQPSSSSHPYPALRDHYAHQYAPAENPSDPAAAPPKTVPDCQGASYNVCVTRLQDAGFGVSHRNTRTSGAALALPEGQPNQVFGTSPGAGSSVAPDTDVGVDTNPAQADMPFIMPDLSGMSQTEAEEAMGPFGAPAWSPQVNGDPNLDYGPSATTAQSPAPGTRSQYGTQTETKTNPSDAPVPGGATGAPTNCGLSAPAAALNFAPLTDVDIGNRFPFSFIGYLGSLVGALGGAVTRPNATMDLFGYGTVDFGFLRHFDGVAEAFRSVVAALLWVGAGWFCYDRTVGSG